MATKAAIGGQSYTAGEAARDGAIGAVDGAMTVGAAGPGRLAGKAALDVTAAAALKKGGAETLTKGMVELAGRDLLETSATVRTGVGAVSGGASGAVAGAASGATRSAVAPGTFDQGVGPGLGAVGDGAASGGLTGAVGGAVIGGAAGRFGVLPDLRSPGRVNQSYADGDNRWTMVGTGEEMLATNRALESAPRTVELPRAIGSQKVSVYGVRSDAELAGIQEGLARLDQLNPGLGIPKEIHVRSELGTVENTLESGNIGGLGGDGRTVILDRAMLKDPGAVQETLYHEVGHNLDVQFGDLSENAGASLFGQGECVSDYARANAAEDFAETHRSLIQNWESITEHPELFVDNGTDVGAKYKFILDKVYGVETEGPLPMPEGPEPALPRVMRPGPSATDALPPTWRDADRLRTQVGELDRKIPAAAESLRHQQEEAAAIRQGMEGIEKPPYVNPGSHQKGLPRTEASTGFRGGGDMTTPLPPDAEEVYRRAMPEVGAKGRTWWGQSANGDWYRFSGNGQDVHWNGASGTTGGKRAFRLGDVDGDVRRLARLDQAIAEDRPRLEQMQTQRADLGLRSEYADNEFEEARAAALETLGRPVDPKVAAMRFSELRAAASDAKQPERAADAAALLQALEGGAP